VVTHVTVTLLWLVFFVLNRTTVIGRRNVGEERNTLLLSNHQSMLDSFLVGLAAFYPGSWLKPRLIPWNPAAAENFYKNPLLAWLADNWKCIWVREGRRDLHALHRMIQVLPRGVMTLFPEGTRSRDGAVGPGAAPSPPLAAPAHAPGPGTRDSSRRRRARVRRGSQGRGRLGGELGDPPRSNSGALGRLHHRGQG